MRLALRTFLKISSDIREDLVSLCPYLQKSGALLDKARVCSKLSGFFLPSITFQLPHLILSDGRCPGIQGKWKCGRKKRVDEMGGIGDLSRGAESTL